jgi:hypothetical protein
MICPLCYCCQLFVCWGFQLWTEAGSFKDIVFILKVGSNQKVMVNVGDIIRVKILSQLMLQLNSVPYMYFV